MIDNKQYDIKKENIDMLRKIYNDILPHYKVTVPDDFDVKIYDGYYNRGYLKREESAPLSYWGSRFTWLFHGGKGEKIYLDSYGTLRVIYNEQVEVEVSVNNDGGKKVAVFSIKERANKDSKFPYTVTTVAVDSSGTDLYGPRIIKVRTLGFDDESKYTNLLDLSIEQYNDSTDYRHNGIKVEEGPVNIKKYMNFISSFVLNTPHCNQDAFELGWYKIKDALEKYIYDMKKERLHVADEELTRAENVKNQYVQNKERALKKIAEDWDKLIEASNKEIEHIKAIRSLCQIKLDMVGYETDHLEELVDALEHDIEELSTTGPDSINDILRNNFGYTVPELPGHNDHLKERLDLSREVHDEIEAYLKERKSRER